MTKSKIYTVIMIIACVLIVGLVAGLIVTAVKKNKDSGATDTTASTNGVVYDGDGNAMDSGEVYEMPASMVFSATYSAELASQLDLSDMYVNVSVSHNFPYNNVKVDWSAEYMDGTDCSEVITITPESDGSNTAKIQCNAVFNKQVVVTAAVRDDSGSKITCVLDYVKNITGLTDYGMTGTDFDDPAGVDFYATLSDGTITPDICLDYVKFNLKDDFQTAVQSHLTFDVEFLTASLNDIAGDILSGDGETLVTCETEGTYSWSWFIKDFDSLDDDHKKAVYYAWYHAWEDMSDKNLIMTVDTSVTAKYSGKSLSNVTESEYIGSGYLYLSGEQYGYALKPSLTFNNTDSSGNLIVTSDVVKESLACYFDSSDSSVISTDSRVNVSGKQTTCSSTTVAGLNKSFEKYLKVESSTKITFSNTVAVTLTLYCTDSSKRIKVDGVNYTTSENSDGDNIVTVTLEKGTHTITKGDVLGLYGLKLEV